ncbi:serine hydrolase domain-containing protein [Pseudonocardia thermophila]|uniref:serine hydrolase domain-containing protein n=1 Tax=Pseudonocardia thermophila TaxID=1848 RepID=UPI0031E8547A
MDVEAPVAAYWPEFAAAGKAGITVAHVLSHTAGLPALPGHGRLLAPDGPGWTDPARVRRLLERAAPEWPPGTRVGYHGLTWGRLVAEIVERATGTTIGRIVRDDVAGPLGADLDLGTPPSTHALVATPIPGSRGPLPVHVGPARVAQVLLAVDGAGLLSRADAFSTGPRLTAELPAVNGTGTARAVATLYGALAAGTHPRLRPDTVARMRTERAHGTDQVGGGPVRWGLGVQLNPQRPGAGGLQWGPNPDAFGTTGAGGQIGFADPQRRLGVAFVRSHLCETSALGQRLVAAVYGCLAVLSS